jgi:transmembrane sensor
MTEQRLEELIEKYAEETATEEEIQQLMNWYLFEPVKDVQWPSEKMDVYNRMSRRLHSDIAPKKAKVLIFPWQKIAAALVLIIGTALLLFQFTRPSNPSYVTVINPSGKIKEVLLPDNSKVWLNAATQLEYATSFAKNRYVKLKGEAYFEVTHDASHPFGISAGGIETTVLGTSFNIKAYETENKTIISVITGRVKVADSKQNLAVLKPSMQLQFDRQQATATTSNIDTNSVLAWKHGRLQFEGESFGNIAASLERWYDIKIVLTDPAIKNCRYYMAFENTIPLEKIFSTKAEVTGLKYTINKNTVTLSGKGCR